MIVCVCNRITEGEVREAALEGASTPEKAYACLGCEVQCGCCLDYAQEVIDEARGVVRSQPTIVPLARRPVLFAIARALGVAWPGDVSRDALVAEAFGAKRADESHRARLRVEIARLRRVLRQVASISATAQGFAIHPRGARDIVVLARTIDAAHPAVLALLADGESWSSSALALALGSSQRNVQRALESLAAAGTVQSLGRGRSRRWMTPTVPGFATTLLLPAPLPID